jgi:hypothetical protein
MPDLLDRIRAEMSTRLPELRPLVDEHIRLDAALQDLGDADSRTPVSAAPAARSSSRGPQTPATARNRAPRGANRLAVLQAAEDRPGATSAELATIFGVQANTLHALLARLVKSGELQKETLPTGRTDTHSVTPSRKRPRTFHPPPTTPRRSYDRPLAGRRACKAILQYAVRPPRVPPSLRGQLLRVYRSRRIERSVWVVCAWIQRTKASAEMRLPAKEVCT